ncbi:MAG: hypothetical protein JWN08_1339, partial [Frankiales bacterium]|nr:hypothetical protein [Frankiales bacterium]
PARPSAALPATGTGLPLWLLAVPLVALAAVAVRRRSA